jgi:hypothetical protein
MTDQDYKSRFGNEDHSLDNANHNFRKNHSYHTLYYTNPVTLLHEHDDHLLLHSLLQIQKQ